MLERYAAEAPLGFGAAPSRIPTSMTLCREAGETDS